MIKPITQYPIIMKGVKMAEYIERDKVLDAILQLPPKMDEQGYGWLGRMGVWQMLSDFPSADVQPVVRCKDCKHFHLDYFGEVNGVNIIVAHEICDLWAGGCRTTQDTFCSNGARMDGKEDG